MQTSTTLVIAISRVASGLGCSLQISKILRCSTPMASMADALSKSHFSLFWELASKDDLTLPLNQAWVSPALLAWIHKPTADETLGDKILADISKRTLVLGFNC